MFACFEQAVEFLAFVEYRGFRGVQVFGFFVAEHAAAKGDDAATAVANGEHDAVAEAVVALNFFRIVGVFNQQAGVDHGLLLQAVAGQVLEQVVPAGWGEAHAEIAGDFA